MSVRFMCDDCGEIIEQLRIKATSEGSAEPHDRCLTCTLRHLAEESGDTYVLEFVNPTLEVMQQDGRVC